MTDAKEALYISRIRQLLYHARGRTNAITLDRIVKLCGIPSRRDAESLLEHHLEDLGFCVVSGGKGYWRPLNAEELNHYRNSLRSRAMKILKRYGSVKRMGLQDGFILSGKQFQDPPAVQGDLFTETSTNTGATP